jgi:capsular polysaccharide transport system ATP-binding protein
VLVVRNLSKEFVQDGRKQRLFENLSFTLAPSERLAVLGRNGQGKSTLIKILGGVLAPTSGDVRWSMTASWPLGFGGAFQGALTGIDNIRFLARIYDRPAAKMLQQVESFAELGDALTMPVKHYSSGMRARLAFGMSLAIEFDCYLIDEVIAVGDVIFRERCEVELFEKRASRSFIIASHDMAFLRNTCNRAIVIERGQAVLLDNLEEAIEIYEHLGRSVH